MSDFFKLPGGSIPWRLWQSIKCTNPGTYTVPDADLRDHWILITGANNGIGREAALRFASWGANIILACRNPPPHEIHPEAVVKECYELAKARGHQSSVFEWWTCDMADLNTVKSLGERWLATERPLDLLINNAGMSEQNKCNRTKDGLEIVHQVNFISHTLLTMIVLPSIARAKAPRIICTTSCMQYFGTFDLANANCGINAYSHNKLYFQTWLTAFQMRCLASDKYRHITINGVHPGYVKTGIWVKSEALHKMSWPEYILNVCLEYIGIDAQQGSLTILNAATNPACGASLKTQGIGNSVGKGGGRFFNRTWEEVPMPQTKDARAQQAIWDFVDQELRSTGLGSMDGL